MKKPMLYIAIGFVVLFIFQVFRNSPVTDVDNSKSPMYGFERDTTEVIIPPTRVVDKGTPVKDPLVAIKEQLYAYKYLWFANKAEYMVKDDDFIEPIIEEVLASENDGKLPQNSGGVETIARQVIYAYSAKIKEPAGLERTERLIQKRYDTPTVRTQRNGDYLLKTIDLGVLPTKLSVSVRYGIVRTRNSGVVDENGRWDSKQIAKQILKYNEDSPDKITFRAWFSPYYGGLEKSFFFTYIANKNGSAFPPLIRILPENAYGYYTSGRVAQTLYLFHTLEEYMADKYSVYDINQQNYKQSPEWKTIMNR